MIDIIKEFQQCRGAILGLQQSAIVGALRIRQPDRFDLPGIDERMRALLGEAFNRPEETTGQDAPAAAIAHRIAQWTIAVQRKFRIAVSERFRVGPMPGAGHPENASVFQFALPCTHREPATAALRWVCSMLVAPPRTSGVDAVDETGDAEPAFERLAAVLRAHAEPGLNTYYLVEAALSLDLPVARPFGLFLLIGAGRRGRWFESTITDRTSAFGVKIARNKQMTAALLRKVGLPGARNALAESPEAALAIAGKLGYPVVVKPADLDQGKGVAADLREPAQVLKAYHAARAISRSILVEKHVEGFTHRLTVVEGRLVKAAKRIAGGVFGDGVHTVRALVELAQQAPEMLRRRQRIGRPVLVLDEEAVDLLGQSGLSPDHVPPLNAYVRLRRRDNINAGGTNLAVPLDLVHPDNAALAVRIAMLLRLDFAGIDLITPDVGRSWLEGGALVCEVNAQPQMGTNDTPDLYRQLLRDAFPDGARIPATLVVPLGSAASGQTLPELAEGCPPEEIFACADGLFIAGRRASTRFESGYDAALAAFAMPGTRSLRFAMTAAEILNQGLPIDHVDRLAFVGRPADERSRSVAARVRTLVGDNAGSVEYW